jgi:hypothetical protein
MVPLYMQRVFRQVWSNINGQYTCKLTNSAQKLAPYRFELKFDTNRIEKYCLLPFMLIYARAKVPKLKEWQLEKPILADQKGQWMVEHVDV